MYDKFVYKSVLYYSGLLCEIMIYNDIINLGIDEKCEAII